MAQPGVTVPECGPQAPLSSAQLDEYGHSFTPAVIRGVACDWPATQRWGLGQQDGRLRTLAGDACVSVMRSSSNQFFGDLRRHCPQPALFSEVLDSAHGEPARHLYLAQEPLWTSQQGGCLLAPLLADVPALPPPLLAGQELSSVNIWMSPLGSNSSVHYDQNHNLLVVVTGAKRVRLWSPTHNAAMRPMMLGSDSGNHCGLPTCVPDVPPDASADLLPGDALFIPEGWWHQVESNAGTIALNFWWRSHLDVVLSRAMEHPQFAMEQYIARRCVDRSIRCRKDAMLAALRLKAQSAGHPATTVHAALLAQPTDDELAGQLVEDIMAVLTPNELRGQLEVLMSTLAPGLLARLLLRCLTPASAELLTTAFEAVDADTGRAVFPPVWMDRMYAQLRGQGGPSADEQFLDTLCKRKDKLTETALGLTLESVCGVRYDPHNAP